MIDIYGKSQIEIEEMFSPNKMREYQAIALAEFVEKISQETYVQLQAIVKLNEDQTYELMLDIISLFGNELNGIPMSQDFPHIREFDVNQMVLGISSFLPYAVPEKYEIAMDIIAEFDGVLWEIDHTNVQNDEGQWFTMSFGIVDYIVAPDAAMLQQYKRFRLPLIEEPIPWGEGESGGYHLSEDKVTLNKGEAKQPQNCLDVINKLQEQKYTIREYNIQEEYEFVLEQLRKKNWKQTEEKHIEAAAIVMQTRLETYETMRGREFFFALRPDFRGRLYFTAYDINPQGNKYQKALIEPVFN